MGWEVSTLKCSIKHVLRTYKHLVSEKNNKTTKVMLMHISLSLIALEQGGCCQLIIKASCDI